VSFGRPSHAFRKNCDFAAGGGFRKSCGFTARGGVVAVPAARWDDAGAAVAARFSPTRVAVSRPVVGVVAGPPQPPVSQELRLRGSRTRVAASPVVVEVVRQELRFRGSGSRVDWPCVSSVLQNAEPGAAPDPAASFVSCSGPNVRVGGCGRGRAGELDRSAVRAMRFARIATSRPAVNIAGVAVSRQVVGWLQSRRHDGSMRVPRSPRGSAPPELRFHGRWWCGCAARHAAGPARIATSRQAHKSGLFAAPAGVVQQELRFHGNHTRVDWPCVSSVSQNAEPGAAPDPAASSVSCSGLNVHAGGCGPGRAGELDRSATTVSFGGSCFPLFSSFPCERLLWDSWS
jgi:hypothetical protein